MFHMLHRLLRLLKEFFRSIYQWLVQCFHSNKDNSNHAINQPTNLDNKAIEIKISANPGMDNRFDSIPSKLEIKQDSSSKTVPAHKQLEPGADSNKSSELSKISGIKSQPLPEKMPVARQSDLLEQWISKFDSPQSMRKSRKVTTFKDNASASLKLPYSNEEFDKIKGNPEAYLTKVSDLIKEHAARRVDLYFYLLVAVYKTHLNIAQGDTLLQHGKGSAANQTHACHSSLFPSLLKIKKNKEPPILLFSTVHFFNSLNSTLELPKFVNNLDSELEGKINNPSLFRKRSLDIMQQVANGEIDPVAGLEQFLQAIEKTFKILQEEKRNNNSGTPYLLRNSAIAPRFIKNKLIELEKNGTFCEDGFGDSQPGINEYANLLLRLRPEEIAKCEQNKAIRQEIYLEKIYAIQKEIYTSTSNLRLYR